LKLYKLVFVLLLFVLISVFPLSASEQEELSHVIAYYSIEIKGSSWESIIRELIIPPEGDPPFESLESLEKALEDKRNRLNNLRIFEDVSYTYEVVHTDETAVHYRVKFFIDDAFTFFAIPYPKYDSNYGFRVGLKAYDKNLFGTFADLYYVINTTQIDNKWDSWKWFSEITIKNLRVGESRISVGATVDALQEASELTDVFYKVNLDWTAIPFADSTMSLHVDLDESEAVKDDGLDMRLRTHIDWNDLPWFNSSLRIRPSFTFDRLTDEAPWDIDVASLYSAINPVKINGESYLLENTLTLKFPHVYFRSYTKLSLLDAQLLGIPFSFWISSDNYYHLDNFEFYDNTYSVGTSFRHKLPLGISYNSSYSFIMREGFATSSSTLNMVPRVSTTQSISFGSINWVGNFRKGFKGTLWGKADYAFFSKDFSNIDYLNYAVQAEIQTHLTLWNRISLSSRTMGFYSHVPSFDWWEDQSFPEFLPNGTTSAPEALRGILDATYESTVGEDAYQKLGAVANIDATLKFIKLGNFAEGFMSAFMDIGVFTPLYPVEAGNNTVTTDDLIILKTVGVEGYGIMYKFPSYPIRGSLGFNLDDVIDHFAGNLAFSEIEYELTIGMGLHY